jgi:hypothetical protein
MSLLVRGVAVLNEILPGSPSGVLGAWAFYGAVAQLWGVSRRSCCHPLWTPMQTGVASWTRWIWGDQEPPRGRRPLARQKATADFDTVLHYRQPHKGGFLLLHYRLSQFAARVARWKKPDPRKHSLVDP